jgi:hypothetical protein
MRATRRRTITFDGVTHLVAVITGQGTHSVSTKCVKMLWKQDLSEKEAPTVTCLACLAAPSHTVTSYSTTVDTETYTRQTLGVPISPSYVGTFDRCSVPMCGESGVCDACRKRGNR